MKRIPIGILVSSDRAAAGVYDDRGGPAIVADLTRALATPFDQHVAVCADEMDLIATTLIAMAKFAQGTRHVDANFAITTLETNPEVCRAFRPAP